MKYTKNGAEEVKIAYVGGGSRGWAWGLMSDLAVAEDMSGDVYLYDIEGKKYLDFAAGIAVFSLGYGNETYKQALKDQIDKILHTSNLYYNVPAVEAATKIVNTTGMERVFFTNSGTEAIEGVLKAARKYAENNPQGPVPTTRIFSLLFNYFFV